MLEPGDWVEGEPKWWWKYVLPARDIYWATVLHERAVQRAAVAVAGPSPDPWREQLAEILEGAAMIDAAVAHKDKELRQRLQREAAEKIIEAARRLC